MDIFSLEKRSDIMRRVRATGTKPEDLLRKELFRRGWRYRKNNGKLPGKPDITFAGRRVAVFVNGCFWHQHSGCKAAERPKSNETYWHAKLDRNIVRDEKVRFALETLGWIVIVVWECEIKADLAAAAGRIEAILNEPAPDERR